MKDVQNKQLSKNILYIHNKVNISGGEQSLLNLWRNIDTKKYRPYLLIPRKGKLFYEAERLRIDVAACYIPKLRPENFYNIFRIILKVGKYCLRKRIDIIHSYSPRNNIICSVVGRILGISVVWHERNLIFEDEPDISRKFIFLPHKIICNSTAIAERFRTRKGIPSKVKVVMNGVDLKEFQPGKANPKILHKYRRNGIKAVGLISNLGKRKIPEYLIDTCPYILQKCPETIFLIVGGEFGEKDKGRKAELEERAKSLGVSNHIIFAGFLSNVSDIIRVFDIGVAVTEKEACSRAILEMMASGKPVVAFDTGGNAELIEHGVTGILVKFGDKRTFASSVVDLLEDEEKRRKMSIQARRRAEEYFDVRINAQKTQKIYSELIGKKFKQIQAK